MTSGRAGALKPREPLKADDQWPPSKGGLPSVARPGGKGLARRNHEAPLIPWNGRAPELRNADCGMRIEKKTQNPKSAIQNPKFKWPMLSARNALAPGPRPRHSGKVKFYESPGAAGGE